MGSRTLFVLLPCAAIALFVTVFLSLEPLTGSALQPPPRERLNVEQVEVNAHGFRVQIRADSPHPLLIAQVMVDGAYWEFSQDPPGPLKRINTAWISIDFPWVADELHHLRFVSALGTTFDHTVDVALPTPEPSWRLFARYALLGILVGVVPVALGMLFFPAVRALGARGIEFFLSLTIGLLGYLFVDMTLEGLESAARASAVFGGAALVVLPMVLTFVTLLTVGGRSRLQHDGARVAWLIASGIGLHNFGEGLAIGASFAAHEVALTSFLILGFSLHNTTEGLGVVSPLIGERVSCLRLALLALLAGLPTVPGIWIGAFSYSPHWAAVFFGIGAGAVIQVVLEIDRFVVARVRSAAGTSRFTPTSVAGYCAGAAIMYLTALILSI